MLDQAFEKCSNAPICQFQRFRNVVLVCFRRHTPYYTHPDIRIYELNRRLQQRTEVGSPFAWLVEIFVAATAFPSHLILWYCLCLRHGGLSLDDRVEHANNHSPSLVVLHLSALRNLNWKEERLCFKQCEALTLNIYLFLRLWALEHDFQSSQFEPVLEEEHLCVVHLLFNAISSHNKFPRKWNLLLIAVWRKTVIVIVSVVGVCRLVVLCYWCEEWIMRINRRIPSWQVHYKRVLFLSFDLFLLILLPFSRTVDFLNPFWQRKTHY